MIMARLGAVDHPANAVCDNQIIPGGGDQEVVPALTKVGARNQLFTA
jgi:hypothetical protein